MLSEGDRPPENVQHPRPWPLVAQRARMHAFSREGCKPKERRAAPAPGSIETKSWRKAKRWA